MGRNWHIGICLFLFGKAAAQPVANAVFSKKKVETGDTFNLRLVVAGPAAVPGTVDFSAWKDFLPPENILRQSNWNRSGKNWAKDFTLISFDSADLKLPPLVIALRANDSVRTNRLELRVFPTPASDEIADMADIRDIQRAPVNWLDHWKWILAGLAAAALTGLFFRKKPAQQPAPPPPFVEEPVSLLDSTLQKLNGLEKKGLWQKGEADWFCTDLSMIVREFLEKRYAIKALESTTREILAFLKACNFPENQTPVLRELLQQTDYSKFSELDPPADFAKTALRNARNLVLQTAEAGRTVDGKPLPVGRPEAAVSRPSTK